MPSKRQIDQFKSVARDLNCDEDEKHFDAKMKRLKLEKEDDDKQKKPSRKD